MQRKTSVWDTGNLSRLLRKMDDHIDGHRDHNDSNPYGQSTDSSFSGHD